MPGDMSPTIDDAALDDCILLEKKSSDPEPYSWSMPREYWSKEEAPSFRR